MMPTGSLMWTVAGAALFGVVLRFSMPPLAWIALALLIHASRSMSPLAGSVVVWIALYVALAIGGRGLVPVDGPSFFVVIAALTSSVTVPFALDRLAVPRLTGVQATLVFPLAWVAVEFLRSRYAPPATWFSIAYTQYGYLPLMQAAAFVGIWGLTFLVAWCASTFDWAWSRGFEWSVVRTPVLASVALVAFIVLGGSIRLASSFNGNRAVRTATLNRPVDLFVPGEMTRITEGRVSEEERGPFADKLSRLHDWFLEGSRREARAGARLVVWPEGNLLIFKDDETPFLQRAQQLAASERIYLAMGMGTIELGSRLPFENKVVLIDPAGRMVVSYRKSHAVAGWEASIMKLGDGRLPVIDTSLGRMAAAICFDADFPEFIRQAGLGFADFLILPVNDWKEIKEVHFQMASFRAIENGMPLVRAASSGLSAAFDPWGRVLGVADYFAEGDRTLTVQVPIGRVATLYARTGDLFAWICVAALVLTLGMAVLAA